MSSSAAAAAAAAEATSASAIVAKAVTGSHVLKIEGYSLTKGLGNGEFISSSTFVVGGHRWLIRYYPHGYGSDNAGWITFFLVLHHSDGTSLKAIRFKFSLLDEMGEPVPSYRRNWSARQTINNTGRRAGGDMKDSSRRRLSRNQPI